MRTSGGVKIDSKIEPTWGGLEASWAFMEPLGGPRGLLAISWRPLGTILKGWAGFRSQVRLGRRLGRVLTDLKGHDDSNLRPKRASSCSQNDIKIDAKIDRNIDGFVNQCLKVF